MFEVLGFIAVFICGCGLTFSGFFGVYFNFAMAGKYDAGSFLFTCVGIFGVVLVVLTLIHAPFTIVLN